MNGFRLLAIVLLAVVCLAWTRPLRAQCPGGVCPSPAPGYAPRYGDQPFYNYQPAPRFFYPAPVFTVEPPLASVAGVVEIREFYPTPVIPFQYGGAIATYGGYSGGVGAGSYYQPQPRGRIAFRQRIR